MTQPPHSQDLDEHINWNIKPDQARSGPVGIVTLAVTRCNNEKLLPAERKDLAPTIVPGAHPPINRPAPPQQYINPTYFKTNLNGPP